MKTILVPIDFSDATESVLKTAREIGKAFGSRIVLFHGVETKLPSIELFPGLTEPPSACMAIPISTNLEWEDCEMAKAKSDFDESSLEVKTLILEGAVVSHILEESQRADLIIMGSHGHGALYHLLAGSITQGVLKSATIPVMIVPYVRNQEI